SYNDEQLSLAHAVATFADGRTFSGCGDADPHNVKKHLVPAFRRIACARAKARALRDALALEGGSVEELSEQEKQSMGATVPPERKPMATDSTPYTYTWRQNARRDAV